MTWTPPITWPTSTVTDAQLNANIRDNEKALQARVRAYNSVLGTSSAIGVAPSATGVVSFTGVLEDPSGMWNPASPTRLTVPLAGWYRFRGTVCGLAFSPSGGYRARISKNGTALIDAANTLGVGSVVGDFDVQLAAGDYLELLVAVAAGGSGFSWQPAWNDNSVGIIAFSLYCAADLELEWLSP